MKRFDNIVYVVGKNGDQEHGIRQAIALAKSNQARLTVLEIVPEVPNSVFKILGGTDVDDLTARLLNARRTYIESILRVFDGKFQIQVEILVGRLFSEVTQAVLKQDFDLVMKFAEEPSYIARMFGSDDMHLLRKCPCPVWLIKHTQDKAVKRVMAAVDTGADERFPAEQALNIQILELAASIALSESADLHIVHVWDAPEADLLRMFAKNPDAAERELVEGEHFRRQHELERLALGLSGLLGAESYAYLKPQLHLARGNPKAAIPEFAERLQADLVVMGTVARTGIPGLLIGNTAEAILEQLQCSVLALKPPGFKTPVTIL